MQSGVATAASTHRTSVSLPSVQSSESQLHGGNITDVTSKKDSEVPFLPKVRGGLHLKLASAGAGELQHRGKFLEKPEEQPETVSALKQPRSRYELENTASILEIFARSVDHHLTVDKMWNELKADALKRLRPIIIHSHRLRCGASPSAQQCLDIYKMPTAVDQYTGKPIPLSQVLREVTRRMYTSRGTMSAINVAMRHVARLSQMKAEMMLERKDPYNFMTSSVHQDWYFPQIEQPNSAGSSRTTRTADRKHRPLQVKRIETGARKKLLPCYLTSSGNLMSASLEEFEGAVVYCRPSNKQKKFEVEEEETTTTKDDSSSVFITDIVCPASARSRSDGYSDRGTSLLPISAMGRARTHTDGGRTTAAGRSLTAPTATNNTNKTLIGRVPASPTTEATAPNRVLTAPATTITHRTLTAPAASTTTENTITSRPTTGVTSTSRTLTSGITRTLTEDSDGGITIGTSMGTTPGPRTTSGSSKVGTWEPLNSTALLEHTTVSLIPVRGPGHLAHGHYHMWRPESCHTHNNIIENIKSS